MMRRILTCCVTIPALLTIGCAGRPSIFPNSDRNLRRSSAQFAADAALRHPYKAEAPSGGEAEARAEVDYVFDHINIANLSNQDWKDVEIWVNQNYVVFLPVMQSKAMKKIDFTMLYDDKGHWLPTSNVLVKKLEIYRDGKRYDVRVKPAD